MFKTEFYFNKFDVTVSIINIKIELLTAGGKNTKTISFYVLEQNIPCLDNMSLVSTEPDWAASAKISLHDIENH
jgi:hypothetical protein